MGGTADCPDADLSTVFFGYEYFHFYLMFTTCAPCGFTGARPCRVKAAVRPLKLGSLQVPYKNASVLCAGSTHVFTLVLLELAAAAGFQRKRLSMGFEFQILI